MYHINLTSIEVFSPLASQRSIIFNSQNHKLKEVRSDKYSHASFTQIYHILIIILQQSLIVIFIKRIFNG